jgi:TctA family transporter
MVESSYRRSLVLSGGDHAIFLEDPIAIGLFLASAASRSTRSSANTSTPRALRLKGAQP